MKGGVEKRGEGGRVGRGEGRYWWYLLRSKGKEGIGLFWVGGV